MSVLSIVYQLLIGPLQLFFEILFSLAYRILNNPGLSIVVLSLCMNILVLPLYRRADAMQAEERELEQRLQPWIDHIKKNFSGDERYMILQTFYRQNHYKPTDALKGSLSLLLQVPFFIAAYHFLSGLQLLQGETFGPIQNLGAPDAMFVVSGFTVNVLPILMTLINVVSGMIYTRGMPLKSKIQLYAMAGLFLVLLYQSPAGLVMYWTLNNLFSLVKNLFGKLKNPGLVVCALASLGGVGVLARVLLRPMDTPRHQAFVLLIALLLQLPLALKLLSGRLEKKAVPELTGTERWTFRLGCLFLTLLLGALIPSAVLVSSPVEFIDLNAFRSPLLYVVHTMILAVGTFLIWFNVFYALSDTAGKRAMGVLVWLISGCGMVNYLFFATKMGIISNELQFDKQMHFALREQLLNLAVLALTAALLLLIYRMRKRAVSFVLLVSATATLCMSGFNVIKIQPQVQAAEQQILEDREREGKQALPLSKDGKNVVVLILDRAIGVLFPFLTNERPELKEQFSGFTWYPNTLSQGGNTNFALPEVYGGYEYTPYESNKRDDMLLVDKHNEALKVMPTIFSQAGYQVTVTDPTYAGYTHVPDLSIFDDIPNCNAIITKGRYVEDSPLIREQNIAKLNRNFFCYSLMKIAPLSLQPALYEGGSYNNTALLGVTAQLSTGGGEYAVLEGVGLNKSFMAFYSVLQNLNALTEVQEGQPDSFIIFKNDCPHEGCILQEPDYTPSVAPDNEAYDAEHPTRSTEDGRTISFNAFQDYALYHVNMATMLKVGEWFDYLKEQGVYDNTRIIIVADHGHNADNLNSLLPHSDTFNAVRFNPLLMVKDFGATGEVKTDNTFMTNADTPVLAMEGLIDDPVNPYTGKAISSAVKAEEQMVFLSNKWSIKENNGYTFLKGTWASVHDDITKDENWTLNVDPDQ